MSGGPPISGYPDLQGGYPAGAYPGNHSSRSYPTRQPPRGNPVSQNPGAYPVSINPAGREDLDTSRGSQASYGSRGSRSSGTVHLGGSQYPIGSTVGSSGLFVIGDPGGSINKSTDSVKTTQSITSQYSSVVGGELRPSKGYDFEDWNWPVIRCSCLVLLVAIMVSLLIATIATAVALSGQCESQYDWWQGTMLYQISVAEFYDSDNNNVGDLKGIEERIEYFKYLGVSTLILSNFIKSVDPFWDKLTSYVEVDPRVGTMEDFVSMINALHNNGIKVIVELNAVYTSDQHEWFLASQRLSSESNEIYTNVYHWKSSFGTRDGRNWLMQPIRNQYFQYDFTSNDTTKPLLNWENTRTHILIKEVMEFWLNQGVDGFYVPQLRNFLKLDTVRGRMTSIVRGWAGTIQTFSENVDLQKRVLMIDGLDVEVLERTDRDSVNSLLQAVNLVNVSFSVDPKNITGSIISQIERGLSWQENYLSRDESPWTSFTLVHMHQIKPEHLPIVEFLLAFLPGSPILRYGQEIGRNPEEPPPAGSRIQPMRWSGDTARPFHSGSTLDVTTLGRLVGAIKARNRFPSLRGVGYEINGKDNRGYHLLESNSDILLMKRTQYQEKTIFFAANFDDVRVEKDWSPYTSYGSYISDSAGLLSGQLQLNSITVPKEIALLFSDII